jgi:Ran GTPase-activating protein (RanGAP) involved in mRNA processing and transport
VEAIATGLQKNRNLLALYLSDVAATQKGWTPLMKCIHRDNFSIVRLVISDNPLDPKTLKQLAQVIETNPRLEELDLSRCKLGNESAVLLASLPMARALRKLNLSENGIKEVNGSQIADAPTLTDLNLASNLLGDDSIISIADQM